MVLKLVMDTNALITVCKFSVEGDPLMNLASLRSAIGIMEQWNSGMMGFGEMGHWGIDKISIDIEVNKRVTFP